MKTFNQHIKDYVLNCTSPYGDGKSAERILNILFADLNYKNS